MYIYNLFLNLAGPNNKEFIEPKVQGLWRLAAAANFTVDELASLKVFFYIEGFLKFYI